MFRQGVLTSITVALLFFGVLATPANAAEDVSEGAHAFISKLADDVVSKLTDPSVGREEQERRFSKLVTEYIAFKSIARWVLGRRAWRSATEEQRETYFTLFSELMSATYAHRFQKYAGEALEVIDVKRIDASQALVKSEVQRPGATKPLSVDWRVRRTKDQFKVIDIMIEGLSMAQTQRSEFKSFLKANGNSVSALLDELEARISKARSESSGETKQSAQTQ